MQQPPSATIEHALVFDLLLGDSHLFHLHLSPLGFFFPLFLQFLHFKRFEDFSQRGLVILFLILGQCLD